MNKYELITGEGIEQDTGLDADRFQYLLLHFVKITIRGVNLNLNLK